MRCRTRVGLFFACIGLIAPRVFGDAIALEGKTFSAPTEVFLIEVEQGSSAQDGGSFSLEICSHCKVSAEGPFLFNPNLSQVAFGRDFFAPFSGVSSLNGAFSGNLSLPTALLSSSINAIASSSTAQPGQTVTTAAASGGSGGSTASASTSSTAMFPTVASSSGSTTTTRTVTSTAKAQPLASNPEPATVFLLGTGLAVGVFGRRTMRGRRT